MLRRLALALIVMGILGGSLSFGLPVAAAASQCDETIVDEAGVLGDGRDEVQDAVQKLSKVGVDVRVRVYRGLKGFPELDNLIANVQGGCASWRHTGRMTEDFTKNFKNNFLVFAAAITGTNPQTGNPTGKVGIYFGEKWEDPFEQSGGEQRIWGRVMGPRFAQNDWPGGFSAGMDEALRVFNEPARPGNGGNANPVVVQKEPTDYSGLWLVLGILVGLAALALLIFFVYRVLSRRREAEEARKVMRQRALSARDAATTILREVGGDNQQAVRQAKVKKYSAVSSELAEQLAAALQEVNTNYEAATSGMNSAASASANADDAHLGVGEYEQMAKRYEKVLNQAQAAQEAAQLIDGLAEEAEARFQRLDQDLLAVQAEIDQINGSLQSLKDDGIHVTSIEDHLVAAQASLQEAQANQGQLAALNHLEQAGESLRQAEEALSALNQQREQLVQDIPGLESRITEVTNALEEARACFERISSVYAHSSWESVKGNGTEANKRIKAAEKSLADAKRQGDVKHQDWEAALASLQEGNLLLDQAQSLLRSITELETNLKMAEEQAPQEIEAAKADLDKAAQYLAQYDDDIREELEGDLREAHELLAQAESELAEKLPDYLRVVELAAAANAAADRIYEEAATEHEAAERLRRQAASALTQAASAVSRAEEFIDDHRSDVGSTAENKLSSAKQALQRARSSHDPADVLSYANSATEDAKDAYARAKHDFDDAEDEREEERRAASISLTSISVGSSHDSGSSWGSFGGGSSGSFGGFGGGGGSSGSFGGSGGGGGGSSGGF